MGVLIIEHESVWRSAGAERLALSVSRPQGKLVSISKGSVYDVAVDINLHSPTYDQVAWRRLER